MLVGFRPWNRQDDDVTLATRRLVILVYRPESRSSRSESVNTPSRPQCHGPTAHHPHPYPLARHPLEPTESEPHWIPSKASERPIAHLSSNQLFDPALRGRSRRPTQSPTKTPALANPLILNQHFESPSGHSPAFVTDDPWFDFPLSFLADLGCRSKTTASNGTPWNPSDSAPSGEASRGGLVVDRIPSGGTLEVADEVEDKLSYR